MDMKYIWQLPQNLIGSSMSKKYQNKGCEVKVDGDITITYWDRYDGVSLGQYIFVNKNASKNTLNHEKGHSKQSEKLGWFYLLTVGLVSFIWCRCFENYRQKNNVSYYSVWPENEADKLGGVER